MKNSQVHYLARYPTHSNLKDAQDITVQHIGGHQGPPSTRKSVWPCRGRCNHTVAPWVPSPTSPLPTSHPSSWHIHKRAGTSCLHVQLLIYAELFSSCPLSLANACITFELQSSTASFFRSALHRHLQKPGNDTGKFWMFV